MTLVGFLILLVIAAICGAIAEAIVGFHPGGFLVSIALGFVGALVGTYLARVLGLPALFAVHIEGQTIEIVWAILGAILLLGIVMLFRRGLTRRRLDY